MRRRLCWAVAALVLVTACSLIYPRHGMQHHVSVLAGADAIRCGVFPISEAGKERVLSSDEVAALSKCMTTARREGTSSYFYMAGPGIDSHVGWGVVSTKGRLMRVHYDSAPCGGPGCRELFDALECSQEPEGAIDIRACFRK